MQRSSVLAVALLAASGCGDYWSSNQLDLDAVEGAPAKISGVQMRHSLMVGLGSTPTRVSSGDPPNAVGVSFSVTKTAAMPDHAGVAARLSCRVGDHVGVEPLAHDASGRLSSLPVGGSLSGSSSFHPSPFVDQIPSICEATFFYMVRPPLEVKPVGSPAPDPNTPGPEADDIALGTVCLADGTLREGTCTAEELPRVPADAPLEISKIAAEIGPHRDGGFGVTTTVLITAGPGAARQWSVSGKVRCTENDGEGRPLSLLAIGRGLAPGESIIDRGSTSPRTSWPEEPSACTLSFQSLVGGERAELGQYCLRDGETTAGTCE